VISCSRLDDQSATDNLRALVYVCSVVPGFAARIRFFSAGPEKRSARVSIEKGGSGSWILVPFVIISRPVAISGP